MNANPPDHLYQMAGNLLMTAEHEQERADEDVVTHLVCSHSRQSIIYFLTGYLHNKNIPVDQPTTIASLWQQCKTIDARFEELRFIDVQCRFELHDRFYCLEHDHVDACLRCAQHIRSIVQEDAPGY